jgi:hypothetical protein
MITFVRALNFFQCKKRSRIEKTEMKLTLEDKRIRLPHVVSYLLQPRQKNKLFSFLIQSKKLDDNIAQLALSLAPPNVQITCEENKFGSVGIHSVIRNGQVLFVQENRPVGVQNQQTMKSLGKGEYPIPMSAMKNVEDEKNSNYFCLPNGLYFKVEESLSCFVDVIPSNLFPSFHSSCSSTCVLTSLLSPYPDNLCSLLKQQPQNHIRLKMPLHQARKAIKNEEQYGFVFSDVLLTVDELFEKQGPQGSQGAQDPQGSLIESKGSQVSPFLNLVFFTCLSKSNEALNELGKQIESMKSNLSSCTVFVVVFFVQEELAGQFPIHLFDPSIKLIIVDLQPTEFETWFHESVLIHQLKNVTVQL